MSKRIDEMRAFFVVDKEQKAHWQEKEDSYCLAREFQKNKVNDVDRAVARLVYVLRKEKPVIFGDERIVFTRTVQTVPELFTEEEMDGLKEKHWIHELGDVSNICVDYSLLMKTGLLPKMAELAKCRSDFLKQGDEAQAHYIAGQIEILQAVLDLSEQYRRVAEIQGNAVAADTLSRVPAYRPESFLDALQMFRILHFTMWCGRNYHNTIGRFDQYMWSYLQADLEKGIYDEESALDLIEEFFLTFNRDSDLYPGMQQGDNGQSMVLGGLAPDGTEQFNFLSKLCLEASLELKLIDPKINLRVNQNTPMETYRLGTKLTKQGLGFPQYSNDDVVIPGLLQLGYKEVDAYNYVCAACWEFIIPGLAMDVPNIEALSFIQAVNDAVHEKLLVCETYEQLEMEVHRRITEQANVLMKKVGNLYVFPAPFLSLMMEGCSEQAHDISLGSFYNNYGFHGTGISSAADSLSAIKKYVFDEQTVEAETLLDALHANYEGYDELSNALRYTSPKMGNNDDYVDLIAVSLLNHFSDALRGHHNDRGGIYRAGTGSAMYYLWHAQGIAASADGRRQGEGISCNYSPSLFAKCDGPVSIIHSFAKPELYKVMNGGPLTLELHDTLFRSEDSMAKVAHLVKSFMDLGGHQLQLNAVNRETMLDAQRNPEEHRNLIVRVWGWSGYFVELDKEYQDHIIARMELTV